MKLDQTYLNTMKKNTWTSFIGVFLVLIFAIVLLKNPENFLSVTVSIFGYGAIFIGALELLYYFRISLERKMIEKRFMIGIFLIAFGLISFFENSLLKDFVIFFLGSYLLFLNANRMEIAFNLKNMSQKIWPYLLSLSSLNLILCFFLIVNPLKISGNTYLSILLIVIEIIYFIQNCVLCFGISKNLQKNEIVKKEEKE